MVTIEIEKIEVDGLKILPIENYYDLTCAKSDYEMSPRDGGLDMSLDVKVNDIKSGRFYITQICKNHTLKITTKDNQYIFDNKDEILKDTPGENVCHFKTFIIKDNIIESHEGKINQVRFFDAPFKELLPHWVEIEFDIEFEAWFQYGLSPIVGLEVKPILKFEWKLYCKALQQDNEWRVLKSSHSNPDDIYNSVQYFSCNDDPLLPCDLNNLRISVKKFFMQYEDCVKKEKEF